MPTVRNSAEHGPSAFDVGGTATANGSAPKHWDIGLLYNWINGDVTGIYWAEFGEI